MKAPVEPGNQSLMRGLRILEAYTSKKRSWGVRELGRELEINAATTYRLIAELASRGYLEQNPETQKYHLGPKVVQIAANYSMQNSLIEVGLRVFSNYEQRFPYNFYIGVMSNDEVIYVAVHESRGPLKITTEPGQSVSVYGSALGKLLLANESDEFIKKMIAGHPLKKITPLTVADGKEFMRQIREIRKLGYAINLGEVYQEIASVATAIRGPDGSVIAGVSLSFPMLYMETGRVAIEEVIDLAKQIGDEISTMNRRTVIR
jgi:IclR family KDG regulon transcriptional repressor